MCAIDQRGDGAACFETPLDKTARSALKSQRPCVVWFTGLSGAGKSTVATTLERQLHTLGRHTYLLDGDVVRSGLSKDLSFTDDDRAENVRRLTEVAKLMIDAGLIVLVAAISPCKRDRQYARGLVGPTEFIEVFVDAPIAVAERRDPKGLYARARRGELRNFTGIDSLYERPDNPDVHLDTTTLSPTEASRMVLRELATSGVLWLPLSTL